MVKPNSGGIRNHNEMNSSLMLASWQKPEVTSAVNKAVNNNFFIIFLIK